MDLFRVPDGIWYLVLFGGKKYDFIVNRILYIIGIKSGITCYFFQLCKDQICFIWFSASKNVDVS